MSTIPEINRAKLTEEQRAKLEQYQQAETQLQTLEDIAKMTQEIINIVDDSGNVDKIGTLLIDIRETLGGLRDKEAPETPDYAKPVVDAVSKLEKALSASIKGIDVKPQIKVDAPAVNVSPPSVDLKGVEKAVSGLSKSFKDAIKDIPQVPKTDFKPLLSAWEGISEQLTSLENTTRMKPQAPTTLKVTNPDGSNVTSGGKLVTDPFDYVARVLTNATTETYTYKSGGSGGVLVATVTVVYTDSTLATISTVAIPFYQALSGTNISVGNISTTAPMTWATGDQLNCSGTYEAA